MGDIRFKLRDLNIDESIHCKCKKRCKISNCTYCRKENLTIEWYKTYMYICQLQSRKYTYQFCNAILISLLKRKSANLAPPPLSLENSDFLIYMFLGIPHSPTNINIPRKPFSPPPLPENFSGSTHRILNSKLWYFNIFYTK